MARSSRRAAPTDGTGQAIVGDPDVFILDEATGHVDNETEALIQHPLDDIIADRTTFAIAHRLSTVRELDHILVLADGGFVEEGDHEELLEIDGLYTDLWRIRVGEFTDLPQSVIRRIDGALADCAQNRSGRALPPRAFGPVLPLRGGGTIAMGTEHASRHGWSAGTATANITPDPGTPHHMPGFNREGPIDGIGEDIHAKVLVLEDSVGERVLFLTYEALSVPPDLRTWIEDECVARWGLVPEAIVTNPSHTHYAPRLRYQRSDVDETDEEWKHLAAEFREGVEASLLNLVQEAHDSLEPVTLSYSHARCGMAMNRRDLGAETVYFDPYPDGPVDHDVPVLVASSDDSIRAILFGYACHPTSLVDYNEISGDWAGYAMDYLEAEYPDATAMFMIGCAGDQKAYPQWELELTEHYGMALGTSVRAAIDARSRREVSGRLGLLRETIELDRVERGDEGDLSITNVPYPVHGIGFGSELTMLSLAGEVVARYASMLKTRFASPLWVAAYAQRAGYIPTRRVLAEGGYEADTSGGPGRYDTSTEARVLDAASAVAERVGARRRR